MILSGRQHQSISACESLAYSAYLSHASFLASTCECCVAIIVGSMPAFASFFKGQMPGASWLASTNSIVRRLKRGVSKSSSQLSPAGRFEMSTSGGFTIGGGHARDKNWLELRDNQFHRDFEQESVRTMRIDRPIVPPWDDISPNKYTKGGPLARPP